MAVFRDGLIASKQHILAALGLDALGHKHLLGLVAGSGENARVAKETFWSSCVTRVWIWMCRACG